ncbi:hypothetical protein [uncultured Ilyobacter sp.]|uniref:hypothetical protein n=1 Tax=uncultured Ilyobacter sp. TaxID=544433 RepID=UPI0029F57FAB|nr:hypothetical protein [uncultured Ilyobacter sp.]
MVEVAKYTLGGNMLPCDKNSAITDVEKYILKKGNISPSNKYTTKTFKEYYTLWKQINKRSEMTGDVIFSDYEAVKVNQRLEDWKNKRVYFGKRVEIY